MIRSEQTVARIGRRMKTSVNTTSPPRPAPAAPAPAPRDGSACTGAPSPIFWMPDDDQLLAGLQAAEHDVVVADDRAERHRRAACADQPAARPVSATNTKNWPLMRVTAVDRHRQARRRAPDDARAHELIGPELAAAAPTRRLHQHRLRRVVDRRRDEVDLLGRERPRPRRRRGAPAARASASAPAAPAR